MWLSGCVCLCFFSSRRRHTISVSAFLLNRSSDLLDLPHQVLDETLARDDRETRNVVDRLLRVKLRALAADLRQDVDQVRLDVEEAELEHGEEADRPRPHDDDVRLDVVGHALTISEASVRGSRA